MKIRIKNKRLESFIRTLGVILLIILALSLASCSAAFNQNFAQGLQQSQGTSFQQNGSYVTFGPNGPVQTRTTTVGNTTYVTTFSNGHTYQGSYQNY